MKTLNEREKNIVKALLTGIQTAFDKEEVTESDFTVKCDGKTKTTVIECRTKSGMVYRITEIESDEPLRDENDKKNN
ncbi:MAG: hypothetical protein IKA36_01335 [Clostridia bacterium]|nr:hypothetical protein [Clostridia bacterium]